MMRCISISGDGIFINALEKCCLPVFFAIKRLILIHFEAILFFLSAIEIRENQKIKGLSFCINQPPAILKIRKRVFTQTHVMWHLFGTSRLFIYFRKLMKKESENIDFWIGRIIIIFFFLFLMSFSNRDSNSQIDNSILSIEQVADIHNSAILIEPVGIPNYDISRVDCELYDKEIGDINFGLWISNNTINHQFKSEELRFFTFKPRLLRLRLITLKTSSNEDYLLIS